MSDYRVPDNIKKAPKLCMDCKWSEIDKCSPWNSRCFNLKVVMKDYWALAHNREGQPYGTDCGDERRKRIAQCGQKGKLWEPR